MISRLKEKQPARQRERGEGGVFTRLKALVLMQLKDKMDLSFLRSKRRLIFKLVLSVLLVAAVTGVIYVLFSVAVMMRVFSFWAELPVTVVGVIFIAMFLLSVLSATAGLTDALYLAKDNAVLLTLPVPANQVFLSKLIIYYIFELKKNALFSMPLFIAYGLVNGLALYYYPWMIVCLVLVSLLPVLLGAVLSIPAMFVYKFIRRFRWMQIALFVLACAGATWLLVALIGLIPENINIIGSWGTLFYRVQDALSGICNAVLPVFWFTRLIVGQTVNYTYSLFSVYTAIYLGVLLGAAAVLFVIAFFASRPLFFRMASGQFEFRKKTVSRPRRNAVHGKRLSAVSEELRKNFRSGSRMLKYFLQIALMPVAVLLLNRIYAAMDTRLTGEYMTVAFNVLVMLLLMLSFNAEYATVYSKEGNARYLLKTRPAPYLRSTLAKLVLPAACSLLSVIASMAVYADVAGLGALPAVLLGAAVLLVTYAHLLWSAELDIMNPQSDQYATVGVSFHDPNERKAVLLAFLLSAAFAAALYFLLGEGSTLAMGKICAIAAVLCAVRAYLYCTRVRLYYAEK